MKLIVIFIFIALHCNGSSSDDKLRLSKLENVVAELQSKVSNLEKTNVDMQRKLEKCGSVAERVRRRDAANEIAFSASLPNALTGLSEHRHVEYSREVIDTSNSYNPSDGTFTAPANGVYVFTWSVSCHAWQSTELVVDGSPQSFSLVDSESGTDYGSGSQTIILRVNKGQHVWIRTGHAGDGKLDGGNHNSFSGWILYLLE